MTIQHVPFQVYQTPCSSKSPPKPNLLLFQRIPVSKDLLLIYKNKN